MNHRKRNPVSRVPRIVLSALAALIAPLPMLGAQDGVYDWGQGRELHPGIRFVRIQTDRPRKLVVHGARIDAWLPGLRLHTTPRRGDWVEGKTETDRQTTRDFLRQSRSRGICSVLAVNANAFSPWPAPYNETAPTDLAGLAPTERANGNHLGVAMDAPRTTHDPNLYLFVDDHWIAHQQGLTRIHNRARPLEKPVLWPDDPKTETDCAWGNVIREPDGRFRLWYVTMTMGHNGAGPHEIAAAGVWGRGDDFTFRPRSDADRPAVESMLGKYAESDDGIHWRKPKLGLIEYRGTKENNILLTGRRAAEQTGGALTNFDGYTILRDDREANPDRRYKMVAHWESVHFWDNHAVSGSLGRPQSFIDRCAAARGEYITYSPDGLRWEQPLERLTALPTAGGDRLVVVPDRRNQRWMAYVRAGGWSYPAFSYSSDLLQWSAAEPARQITPELVKAPAVECMIPFNYGNQDLGFPCGMDKPKGVFTVMLASRQQQGEWTWANRRETFIPYGPPGSYYATGAVPLHNEPFLAGDEMLIFFNAFSRQQAQPCPYGSRSIGVAQLRRDGFAGLTAADGQAEGQLTTKPIRQPGGRLSLNVELRGGDGSVTVALLDEQGNEFPGYGFAESVPVTSDAVRAPVTWKSGASLKPLAGQTVRVAIRIRGSTIIYAMAFNGGPAS